MSVHQAMTAITPVETRNIGALATDLIVTDFHLNVPMLLIPTVEGIMHYWLLGPAGNRWSEQPTSRPKTPREDPERGISFQLDGLDLVARATEDNTLAVVEADTDQPIQDPFVGHTDKVTDIAVITAPWGQIWLASASADGTVRLWDPETGEPFGPPLIGHDGPVNHVRGVEFPDQRLLIATAGQDNTVRLWPIPYPS